MVKIGANVAGLRGRDLPRSTRMSGRQKTNRPPWAACSLHTASQTDAATTRRHGRIEPPGLTNSSRRRAADTLRRDQGGQALAGIEHAGLHGVLRDAEDLDDLPDRLLLVVDEVDDLGVLGRELLDAA